MPGRDLALPARDRDGEHRLLRASLRPAARAERRTGRAADAAGRRAALAALPQPARRRVRLAPRRAPRAAVRARRRAAGRARLRGLGAVPRQEHRELVRRARRSRARRRPEPRPQRGRLPAAGHDQQGRRSSRSRSRRRDRAALSTRLPRAAEQAGVYEAALYSASGGVLAVAGVGGSTRAAGAPSAQALRRARLQQTTAGFEQAGDGGLVLRVVVAGQQRRPAGAAQGAAGRSITCRKRSRRKWRKCRPARATTRKSRSPGSR